MLKENKGVVKVLRKICRLSHSTGKLVTGSIQVHVTFLLHFFAHLCELRKGTLMLRGHVRIQNEATEFVMYICN